MEIKEKVKIAAMVPIAIELKLTPLRDNAGEIAYEKD